MRHSLTLIAAAVLVATSAMAAEKSGFYVGGDLGWSGWDTFSKQDARDLVYAFEDIGGLYPGAIGVDVTPTKASVEDTDFTYGLFVGYQFLPWLATEAGWMDLGKTSIKGAGDYSYLYLTPPGPKPGVDPAGGSYVADAEIKTSGWAISVLPMLPIGDAWNLFARLGYFWGDNKLDVKASAEDVDAFGTPMYSYAGKLHQSDSDSAFLWGLGASWTWDRTVTLRFEYGQAMDIINLGGSKSSVDRYTLGVVYRFGQE